MAVPACLTQTTGRGLEGEGLRAAGGHLSGEGHGSVSESLGHHDALVSVAEAAAALLLTASEYWFWEVEGDALLHLEGTAVVQAGQEASLGVG